VPARYTKKDKLIKLLMERLPGDAETDFEVNVSSAAMLLKDLMRLARDPPAFQRLPKLESFRRAKVSYWQCPNFVLFTPCYID
jgi:hypothetical protein